MACSKKDNPWLSLGSTGAGLFSHPVYQPIPTARPDISNPITILAAFQTIRNKTSIIKRSAFDSSFQAIRRGIPIGDIFGRMRTLTMMNTLSNPHPLLSSSRPKSCRLWFVYNALRSDSDMLNIKCTNYCVFLTDRPPQLIWSGWSESIVLGQKYIIIIVMGL